MSSNFKRAGSSLGDRCLFRDLSKREKLTAMAREGMLFVSSFAFLRLWVQFLVTAASILLSLYLMHFMHNIDNAGQTAGYLIPTLIAILSTPPTWCSSSEC